MTPNAYKHPHAGVIGRAVECLVANRLLLNLRRAILSRLPFVVLRSDVVDVVYLTWAVPAEKAAPFVPRGVKLVERDGKVLFTILTYRHGHFGPALAGPLRVLFPSPKQSNWRFYIDALNGEAPRERVVLFVKNILDSLLYCCGSRISSDALPSHLARTFVHEKTRDGFRTDIDGGSGSAPGLRCDAKLSGDKTLPDSMRPFFSVWPEAIEYLCIQHSAIAEAEDTSRLAHAGIDLPIAPDSVQPLSVPADAVSGDFLRQIGAEDAPFSFVVPQVNFRVLWERLL
jgi:hypothetical protein